MAYVVNKTNGSILTTVSDGTIDTTSDLTLIGKNYSGYGEFLNENFVKLLENFSNNTQPATPIAGQLWWDSSADLLKVYTGTQFKVISSTTSGPAEPTGPVVGDLWFDTVNGQLKVYDGSSFIVVGPVTTPGAGVSGPVVESIDDNTATPHVVIKFLINDVLVSTISKDAEFTPQSAISGFSTIKPGYQLSSTVSNLKYHGTATDADALGGVAAANFLRSDANDTTTGQLSVQTNLGIRTGSSLNFQVTHSGSNVTVANTTSDGDVIFTVNDGGVTSTALTIDGATNRLTVAGDPTANLGVATKQYVDNAISAGGTALLADGSVDIQGVLIPDGDGTRNLGSVARTFNEMHAVSFIGQASSAQYADVAEKFTADAQYSAGTVVALGGPEEITAAVEELTDTVFGVVSDQPAYLMNAGLENGVPVAVAGRVPVRVVGRVNKGDRLVSAGNGLARAATANDSISAFNVIGRALESKTTDGEGVVESFVTIN